jgi:PIN domain nuclease of toxin-antitoxin system
MTKNCYLDTHVAVNLAKRKISPLSSRAIRIIESSQVLLSPAVGLEMIYLWEIGRIKISPEQIEAFLRSSIGAQICDLPFQNVVYHSGSLSWTRDVFDRLIVAQAIANGQAPLITFDELIHERYSKAIS